LDPHGARGARGKGNLSTANMALGMDTVAKYDILL
jgi:hypothetical protein